MGKIGVSNHNLDEIKLANAILAKEGLKVSAIQNHYSLLHRLSEDAAFTSKIILGSDEIAKIEQTARDTDISTTREWEKDMV